LIGFVITTGVIDFEFGEDVIVTLLAGEEMSWSRSMDEEVEMVRADGLSGGVFGKEVVQLSLL